MNQQRPSSGNFTQYRNGPSLLTGTGEGYDGPASSNRVGFPADLQAAQPPPIPPRNPRSTQLYNNSYMSPGYSGGYGYGNSWMNRGLGGGYGMYGGYGSSYPGLGSSMYSPYGRPSGDVENRFVQFAEESSRPAFQSIESVVQTFTSISMMLESTFFAMTSSFRAILSVAENVSKVRHMFGELLSTFALVRLMKWLYKKILYMIGVSPEDPNAEQVWKKTAVEVMNGEKTGPATWPILLFISLLIAIPYMINKLVNSVQQTKSDGNDPKDWLKCEDPVYSAIAIYDFNALNAEELSLKRGEKIWLAPQSLQPTNLPGWSKATNSVNVGLVPSDYVRIVGKLLKKSDATNSQETPMHMNSEQASSDPTLSDIDPQMTEVKLSEGISPETSTS